VTNERSVRGSLAGVEGLISAVGKTRQTDRTPRRAVDVDANRYLFAEAARAGLRKVGFISVAGASHHHPAVMMQMKADAEDTLKRTGLPYLIVQPSGYFSDLWEAFEMCRRGFFVCLGDCQARLNPISLRDLGRFVVDRFLDSAFDNATLPIGGPQALSMLDIAGISGRILERKVRIIRIPTAAARFAVALIKPFNRNAWELGQFFVESLAGSRQTDFVLSAYGQDTLEEYFRQRYQQAES
jgi:uncharacterized protein YbjT (DUF2867 family)